MNIVQVAVVAPVIGFALALLVPRRGASPTGGHVTRAVTPTVIQRGESNVQLLIDDTGPAPDSVVSTTTRGVYLAAGGLDTSAWPALVTIGRLGDDDVMVDLTKAGVVVVSGDEDAAMESLRSVWSELRWPADAHELEVVGVDGLALPGLHTIPWSHALTRIERGPERSRPLVVLAANPPAGDDAVRLAAAPPDSHTGVLLVGEWASPWQLRHRNGAARLDPLGLDLGQLSAPPAADRRDGLEPVQLPAPVTVQADVAVSVLGRVEVRGRSLSLKETELAAFLALHPRGATESQIRTALWPERDVPRGTFNNLVSSTRRHLGTTLNGERLLPHCINGIYRVHPAVACDLVELDGLVRDADDGNGEAARLINCLKAMRGRPFEGCASEWPFDDGLVSRAETVIVRAARGVSRAAVHEASVDAAIDAVVSALAAVPDPSIEDTLNDLRQARLSARG
jgi:hypothetical protein